MLSALAQTAKGGLRPAASRAVARAAPPTARHALSTARAHLRRHVPPADAEAGDVEAAVERRRGHGAERGEAGVRTSRLPFGRCVGFGPLGRAGGSPGSAALGVWARGRQHKGVRAVSKVQRERGARRDIARVRLDAVAPPAAAEAVAAEPVARAGPQRRPRRRPPGPPRTRARTSSPPRRAWRTPRPPVVGPSRASMVRRLGTIKRPSSRRRAKPRWPRPPPRGPGARPNPGTRG